MRLEPGGPGHADLHLGHHRPAQGCRLVHDNWTYEGTAVDRWASCSPDDVQYLWLPLSHVFGKMLLGIQLQHRLRHRRRRAT